MVPPDFSLRSVEVSLTPMDRFREFLESRGKRLTMQKKALVETVFSRHEHFEADDLVAELTRKDGAEKVSRPTVYRCLSELESAGLLRKIELPNRTVYEHDYGYPQHDHLYCDQCHRLIEFQSKDLVNLRNTVAELHQFFVNGHRFVIHGICSECRQQRRRTDRPVDRI
jgi:Fur family transcriptional regulator, ferric uptake regulator